MQAGVIANVAPDLQLQAVSKRFGDVVALDAISLLVERGEFVTLLGPSGCGKTTTLRIIAGFEQQTTGSVAIRGKRVDDVPSYRRNVNTVFQNYALFPHLSVFENIAFGLRVKKLPTADIHKAVGLALEQVKLPGFEKRRPHELSGGQQQRVALARALVNQPAILLLDEPLGALDLKLRREMQLELKRVHREVGITFIYVTHDQEEALTMSDRIAVMSDGKVVQVGSPQEVYSRPLTTFVANFVGLSNFFEGIVCDRVDGVATVAVHEWSFRKPISRALMPGGKVSIAVRPEKIRIGTGLAGQVEDIIYVGSRVTLVIRLNHGARVHVEDNATPDVKFEVGQPIQIGWRGADSLVYEAEHHSLIG